MASIQHVYRRGHIFWWRRVLCIHGESGCDIRLSLGTADRRRARELGAMLTAASEGVTMLLEEQARRRPDERPSEAELQVIAKAEFQNQLARYCDQQREHPRQRAMHSAANPAYADYGGGQKQRVFLARALYRQPRVLIMDEGTAHLDALLERDVAAAIASMAIMRIVVAHRRETIRMANKVYRLVRGRFESLEEVSDESTASY